MGPVGTSGLMGRNLRGYVAAWGLFDENDVTDRVVGGWNVPTRRYRQP